MSLAGESCNIFVLNRNIQILKCLEICYTDIFFINILNYDWPLIDYYTDKHNGNLLSSCPFTRFYSHFINKRMNSLLYVKRTIFSQFVKLPNVNIYQHVNRITSFRGTVWNEEFRYKKN